MVSVAIKLTPMHKPCLGDALYAFCMEVDLIYLPNGYEILIWCR